MRANKTVSIREKAKSVLERYFTWIAVAHFVIVAIAFALWLWPAFQKLVGRELDSERVLGFTVASILFYVLYLCGETISSKTVSGLEILSGEGGQGNPRLLEMIRKEQPKVAQMIEYSSQYAISYISELAQSTFAEKIQLLIHNPKTAYDDFDKDWQERRICNAIRDLPLTLSLERLGNKSLEVECYDKPGSIRGRKFDNKFIALGWYTYEERTDRKAQIGTKQLWGHDNALVVGYLTGQNSYLEEMFNRVFAEYWASGTPVFKVCEACGFKCNQVDKNWLKKVSPEKSSVPQ